jgi:hypothetical protein
MRSPLATALGAAFTAALAVVGCSNNQPSCAAPGAGSFHVSLAYSQTVPVDLFCDAGDIDASACGSRPHPLDGASWTVTVNGGSATITATSGTWDCAVTPPRSAPSTQPDGSTQAGSGCYLLLECGAHPLGDAGTAQVQVQLLAQPSPASTDVLALVHDVASDCCTDEYTGTWH